MFIYMTIFGIPSAIFDVFLVLFCLLVLALFFPLLVEEY